MTACISTNWQQSMGSEIGRNGRNWRSIGRLASLLFLSVPASGEQDGGPAITAKGILGYTVPLAGKAPYQETMQFEFTMLGTRWRVSLRSSLDDFHSVSEVSWDGTNQYAVSFQSVATDLPLNCLVSRQAVPLRSGALQTLWLAFCRDQWPSGKSGAFPNLLTYQDPPPKTNTTIRLIASEQGIVQSASLFFPYNGREYRTETTTFLRQTNAFGGALPLEFTREVFARLGVEFLRGTESTPTAGVSYDKVLEKYTAVVTAYESLPASSVLPTPLIGRTIWVKDERFGGHAFPLTYQSTTGFLSEEALRSDPRTQAGIRSVEAARRVPDDLGPDLAQVLSRRRWVLLVLVCFSFLPAALLVRRLIEQQTQRRRKNQHED